MNRNEKLIVYGGCLFIIALLCLVGSPYYIVEPGETAIRIRFGSIIDAQKESGLYTKAPFIDDIIHMNNRIQAFQVTTQGGLSKDLQSVGSSFLINYKIDDAIALYKSVGTDFEKVIIEPFAWECIKSGLAKFTAEHLVQFRDETRDIICKELKEKLKPYNITLVEVNFVSAIFSAEFMHAVEQKQIADQAAKTSKNLTEKIKEEALQTKTVAEAEVYSMRIKAEAEAYALRIKRENLTRDLIELKKIESWNGELPRVVCGTGTMFNLGNIKGE